MDSKYTQNYVDFFSSDSSENIEKTLADYEKVHASFEWIQELNLKLKKIYSELKSFGS